MDFEPPHKCMLIDMLIKLIFKMSF